MPALDLSYLDACCFAFPRLDNRVTLVQVGLGGTGGWLAPHLARLVLELTARGTQAALILVDPDTVERKNLVRQNFALAEVGRNKARTLAVRLSVATGAAVGALPAAFTPELFATLRAEQSRVGVHEGEGGSWMLVGCVDNAAARRALHAALQDCRGRDEAAVWWLDCGNDHAGGQVLLGNCVDAQLSADAAFPFRNRCLRWPAPSLIGPDLLRERPEELATEVAAGAAAGAVALSCAEREARNLQGKMVNLTCATLAATMLEQLLLTQTLRAYRVEFDTLALTTRASYVSRTAFDAWRAARSTHLSNAL